MLGKLISELCQQKYYRVLEMKVHHIEVIGIILWTEGELLPVNLVSGAGLAGAVCRPYCVPNTPSGVFWVKMNCIICCFLM